MLGAQFGRAAFLKYWKFILICPLNIIRNQILGILREISRRPFFTGSATFAYREPEYAFSIVKNRIEIIHRAEDHIEKPRYLRVEFLSQQVDQIGPA